MKKKRKPFEIIILKKHVLLEGYVNHASWSLQCWCQLSANQALAPVSKTPIQLCTAVLFFFSPPLPFSVFTLLFRENKMNKIIIVSNIQDKIPPPEKMRAEKGGGRRRTGKKVHTEEKRLIWKKDTKNNITLGERGKK